MILGVRSIKETLVKDGYVISTDKSKLDLPVIHDFLNNRSYWEAAGQYFIFDYGPKRN